MEIEVTTGERQHAQDIAALVKREMDNMTEASRTVLVIELSRLLKPEIDRIRRQKQD